MPRSTGIRSPTVISAPTPAATRNSSPSSSSSSSAIEHAAASKTRRAVSTSACRNSSFPRGRSTGPRSAASCARSASASSLMILGTVHTRCAAADRLGHRLARGRARVSRDDAALLQHTALFGTMAPDAVERLVRRAVRRKYRRGEVIFREDDAGDSLCVVVSGLVKVYRTSPDGDEMVLVTLGPAAVVGELPMVDG